MAKAKIDGNDEQYVIAADSTSKVAKIREGEVTFEITPDRFHVTGYPFAKVEIAVKFVAPDSMSVTATLGNGGQVGRYSTGHTNVVDNDIYYLIFKNGSGAEYPKLEFCHFQMSCNGNKQLFTKLFAGWELKKIIDFSGVSLQAKGMHNSC